MNYKEDILDTFDKLMFFSKPIERETTPEIKEQNKIIREQWIQAIRDYLYEHEQISNSVPLEALKEIAIQSIEAFIEEEPERTNKINELLNTKYFKIIETALKRNEYLERVNKDLQESKDKLIEERNNKIVENRIIYDDYNFQSIKKFVACKDCQYYENEKCNNTTGCFWLDLENKLKSLEIIKDKCLKIDFKILLASPDYETYCFMMNSTKYISKEEYYLLKEVLL